jgi:transglutaminase-like putative cysteine protease
MARALAAFLAAAIFCASAGTAAFAAERKVELEAPKNKHVMLGQKPDYKAGVSALDDLGAPAKVFIDTTLVDTSVPGAYKAVYRAFGLAGGKAEQEGLVTVTKCDPEEAYALIDGVLAEIIKDGMTLKEKAKAIFDYTKGSIKYKAGAEHATSLDGAYFGLTKGTGDCYTCAALLEQLYERAGIPNVFVARQPTKENDYEHNWVMIDIGGGWYHCDATPTYKGVLGFTGFMFPESLAIKQPSANRATDRYSYDKSLYPEAEWAN